MEYSQRFVLRNITFLCLILAINGICTNCKSSSQSKTNSTSSKDDIDTDLLVDKAKKHIGTKYKLGGFEPKTGFDCSGFTKYVYEKFDIYLPATAALQATSGRSVVISEARKGDLIFFKGGDAKSKTVGHVGIVVSDRGQVIKFIHASSSKGIMISGLDEKYFRDRFVSVRRVK